MDLNELSNELDLLTKRVDAVEAKVGISLAAPTPTLPEVKIIKIHPNDDSFVVVFEPIVGAADYSVCPTPDTWCKYAGEVIPNKDGNISIQVNGVGLKGLTVRAHDVKGPFMDPTVDMGMVGMGQINGHGDPSNVPKVIAESAPFDGQYILALAPPENGFQDLFRDNSFTVRDVPVIMGNPYPFGAFYLSKGNYKRQETDNWNIEFFGLNLVTSRIFQELDHMMTVVEDGGGPGSSDDPHTSNSAMVISPKRILDMSKSNIFKIRFELDAHVDGRKWARVFFTLPGDPIIDPNKFDESEGPGPFPNVPGPNNHANYCTPSGKCLLVEILPGNFNIVYYEKGVKHSAMPTDWNAAYKWARTSWDNRAVDENGHRYPNGTDADIDKRHAFVIEVDQKLRTIHITEADSLGAIMLDQTLPLPEAYNTFPEVQVSLAHLIYHSDNEPGEHTGVNAHDFLGHTCKNKDMRHWDGFSQEDKN